VTQKYVFHSTPLGENLLPRHHLMAFGKQFFLILLFRVGRPNNPKNNKPFSPRKSGKLPTKLFGPIKNSIKPFLEHIFKKCALLI
jgi:hypothetical protein